MKKLLLAIVALVVVAIAGIHFYLEGGEDATELPQGTAPDQAAPSENADSIKTDLQRVLEQKDGSQLSAQISRTLEDARDSLKINRESGIRYLQNAKDFLTAHYDEVKSLNGIDTGLVDWFINSPVEELLSDVY